MIKIILAFIIGIGFYGFLCYYQPIAESYSEQKILQEVAFDSHLPTH
ncbi:MAG: hypothetical protein KatS3mg083_591 [Candidatus Dojkabacteria bacterium]|nr:MAG: hypothetical protein KatS3mg083_591 [Candidatus Dojkabacteria bacterium]